MTASKCPVCGSGDQTIIYESRNTPTQINFLYRSHEEALGCPRGDIILGVCGVCDMIVNTAFDPQKLEYGEGYENALHHSTVFRSYAEQLTDRLIDDFDLREKSIVEVGCGDGTFLRLICERGNNKGYGFDPSAPDDSLVDQPTGVRIIRDYFSDAYSDVGVDFLCSRHTLEHIWDPMTMLGPLRQSLDASPGIPIFFEVPNGLYTLENLFIWDIIYEHTAYFTDCSLRFVFERAGFDVDKTYETFSGQFLCIEARVGGGRVSKTGSLPVNPPKPSMGTVIDRFTRGYRAYVEQWRRTLEQLESSDKKVVVWGGGSKGITFLNLFASTGFIEHVVDINPKKHGMYIAGAGQEIVAPERLADIKPDTVIIVNPVYKDEIEATLGGMGIAPEYLVL